MPDDFEIETIDLKNVLEDGIVLDLENLKIIDKKLDIKVEDLDITENKKLKAKLIETKYKR